MSKEKFTQGKWRVIDFNEWYIAGFFIVDKENNPIAKMCKRFAKTPIPGSIFAHLVESKEEQEANAALISAAPEMYAKLKTVLALCDGGLLRKTRCDILGSEIEQLLAKARGEE